MTPKAGFWIVNLKEFAATFNNNRNQQFCRLSFRYSKKKSGRSAKILWPSQNTWTLEKSRKKAYQKFANFRVKRRLSFTKISQLKFEFMNELKFNWSKFRFEQLLPLIKKSVYSQSKILVLECQTWIFNPERFLL